MDSFKFGFAFSCGTTPCSAAVPVNLERGVMVMKGKYYVRLMRPTFQRAILAVEASSDEAAMRSALEKAEHLSEAAWAEMETEREPIVLEMVFSKEEAEGDSEGEVIDFLRGQEYAYALLQADLDGGEGHFLAPLWLKDLPKLAAADIAQDWSAALSAVCDEEVEAFHAWLARQGRPSNVVDFLTERKKRRGSPPTDPDADG